MAVNKADIEFITGALDSACKYQDEIDRHFGIITMFSRNEPKAFDWIVILMQFIKVRKKMDEMSYNVNQAKKRIAKMAKEVG